MGSKQIGIGLYEFLIESELQHYYNAIKNDLKVQSVSQLKYVTDEDLTQIGMSRPEIRRLKKYFVKHCPQTYLAKMKKKLLHRREDAISVANLSSYATNAPGRVVRSVAPGRHIIQAESIVIHKTLGSGEFGTVQQGVWTSDDGQRTQVAIKCLSQERMENNPVEFLKEAAIMHNVDHEHIVRLYGVVLDTSALMLVTELAPLRSLLECLKEPSMRPNLSVPTLYDFAVQICDGMSYLESKRLIHRDLAARNILVFSRSKVKISDFGLSRALGVGKDYYQTNFNVNLKLPIAWCAPECINFLRFTSASDVWAYGVTLWEMFSYGFQPWAALTGQQILEAIDEPNYQRLERPECCPNEIYCQIMLKCWQHDPLNRPTFSQLSNLILESKPELVQAIRESDSKPRRDFLVYDAGEVITVLDKKPIQTTDELLLWKGVLKDGKSGFFHPGNTITYLGSSLPSVKNSQSPFHRNDSRSSSMRKGRISADMISGPQGDFRHTGHVGPDGEFFGDIASFTKCWVPRQIVPPYKPESAGHHHHPQSSNDPSTSSPARPGPQSSSRSVKESTSDISSSDTTPLLSSSSINTEDGSKSCSGSSSTGVLRRRHHVGMTVTIPGSNYYGDGDDDDDDEDGEQHHYHEISDEENDNVDGTRTMGRGCRDLPASRSGCAGVSNPALSTKSQSPLDSPGFDKNFDLEVGPSLVDEVFSALHEQEDGQSQPDEAHNVKNELREMARSKKKFASVKPISSSDRRTLDHAIAIANELASRSMLDLDRSGGKNPNNSLDDISSPRTPNSPSHRRKFSFILGGKNSERRNYSQEAASIPDIQSTLSEEAKEAYNSLVEKPSSSNLLGFLTPSFENKSMSFHFPEKCSSLSKKSDFFEPESGAAASAGAARGPQSLIDATSSHACLSATAAAANVTNFPGKSHARSLSKNDADEELANMIPPVAPVPPAPAQQQESEEEDEVDGNPLRLLRQNKQAMLTNVLPLPPRKGPPTSQSTQSITRHQRKHPLLIPARISTTAAVAAEPAVVIPRSEAHPPPPPPPKPVRLAQKLCGETSKSPLVQIAENPCPEPLGFFGKAEPENNVKESKDIADFEEDFSEVTLKEINSRLSSLYSEKKRRSRDSILLYENVMEASEVELESGVTPGGSACVSSEREDCREEAPLLPGSSKTTISPPRVLPSAQVGVRQEDNFENLAFKPDESPGAVVQLSSSSFTFPATPNSSATVKSATESDSSVGVGGGAAAAATEKARISPGTSIKMKTLQRILGPSTSEEDCRWALEATEMDSAHAVKLLRLKALLPEALLAEDSGRVVSALEMSHWDVARAAEFLLSSSTGSSSNHGSESGSISGNWNKSTMMGTGRGKFRTARNGIAPIHLLGSSRSALTLNDSVNNNSYHSSSTGATASSNSNSSSSTDGATFVPTNPSYIRPTQV